MHRLYPAASIVLVAATAAYAEPLIDLQTRDSYLPGVPVLATVRLLDPDGTVNRDVWDAEATLEASPEGIALSPATVVLRNGMGSALVTISAPEGTQRFTLSARVEGLAGGNARASRVLENIEDRPVTAVSGDLPDDVTEWEGIVHVTDQVVVPEGKTLRLLPGTLVLIEGVAARETQPGSCKSPSETPDGCGVSIVVRGTIESLGTAEAPITITAWDPAEAWGELHHDGAAPSLYRHTIISRGGHSPRGGHTATGPVIRAVDSTITFDNAAITDAAGKAMQASGAELRFSDCLLTRVVMGPEISGTSLIFERSWVMETYGSDDNDGIYLHDQRPGQIISVRDSVVASGDDDGVDTLGSTITVENCIIRDYDNPDEDSKGISVLQGEVDVRRCLVVNNKEGIVVKGGSGGGAVLRVENCTVVRCETALRVQDKYGLPDLFIPVFAENCILQGDVAVRTDYPAEDLSVAYSALSTSWAGTGNTTADPLFVDVAAHDYRLAPDSPCIDSGNPESPPDPDGSRIDMGVYPASGAAGPRFLRGWVNGDDSLDISDPLAVLLHLFTGLPIPCREAADANDDGLLDVSDAVFLLAYLFRGTAGVPAPREECGVDPTEDDLGCAGFTCP